MRCVTVASCVLALAACGGDDDDEQTAPETAAPATAAPETAPPETAAASTAAAAPPATADRSAEVSAFCEAELAAEAAFLAEDPARIAEANAAVQEAAPVEIADAIAALVSSVDAGGPEFAAAYGEVIAFMKQRCGFTEVDVVGHDHHFEGIPASLPAGPAIFALANDGSELHQLLVFRLGRNTTETVGELAALSEDEMMTKGEPVGAAFAFPGDQGHGTMDLSPGRYVAVCFIPVGTTPETLATAGPGGPPATVPNHASQGMIAEFVVS